MGTHRSPDVLSAGPDADPDGWEREGEDQEYFFLFSPEAYAVATNVIVWMMTH